MERERERERERLTILGGMIRESILVLENSRLMTFSILHLGLVVKYFVHWLSDMVEASCVLVSITSTTLRGPTRRLTSCTLKSPAGNLPGGGKEKHNGRAVLLNKHKEKLLNSFC